MSHSAEPPPPRRRIGSTPPSRPIPPPDGRVPQDRQSKGDTTRRDIASEKPLSARPSVGGSERRPPASPRQPHTSSSGGDRRRQSSRFSEIQFRSIIAVIVTGVLVGATIVAVRSRDGEGGESGTTDSTFVAPSDESSPSTTVVAPILNYPISGNISAEIAELAGDRAIQLRIGDEVLVLDNRDFRIGAEPDSTGLATAIAGSDLLGFDVVPKSDLIEDLEVQITVESTASSLVLLRPELSEFYVIGNPVWDAGVKMMIAASSTFPALVESLKAEAATEGATYLRETSGETERLIVEILESLRAEISADESGGPGESRFGQPRDRSSSITRTDTSRLATESFGYSCDAGLLPVSGAEADGLCFEVVSPPRDRWESHDFTGDIQVKVTNKSPRVALLYYQAEPSAEPVLVGLVPPFSVPSPSVVGIVSKLYSTAAQLDADPNRYRLKDASALAVSVADDSAQTFRLPGAAESGILSAVTVLGAQNAELDGLLTAKQFDFGRGASAVLTLLSSYLFPAMSVVLDNRGLNFRKSNNLKRAQLFAGCSVSTVPDLVGELLIEEFYRPGGIKWAEFLESEGAVPRLFWFVYLRLVLEYQSCDSALEKAELLTICLPSLQAVAEFETYSSRVEECVDSDELFNALVASGIKRALVNIVVSPFEKIDAALAAGALSATALLALGDFLRFGNGDLYPLATLRVPRWCYEVGQSRLRLLGPQRSNSDTMTDVGTLIRNIRDLFDQYAPYASPEFWQRESLAWLWISSLEVPSFVVDSSGLNDDAMSISTKFATIASWFPNTSILGRGQGVAKAISPSGRQEIRDLQAVVARVELAWKPCPNSGS